MTRKLIVKMFQLCSAKNFGTAEENLQGEGVDSIPPYHLGLRK